MKRFLKQNGTLLALIVILLIFWILDMTYLGHPAPGDWKFMTPWNFTNLTRQVMIVGIIAVGMTMVIITGGIDLSVGSIVGLAGIVAASLMLKGVNTWLAIAITLLLCGVVIGLWNGFLIAKFKIPPFIITLGMMTIARGLANVLSNSSAVAVSLENVAFTSISNGFIHKTASFLILGIALAIFVFFEIMTISRKKKYGIEMKPLPLIGKFAVAAAVIAFSAWAFDYKGIPIPVALFFIIVMGGAFVLGNTVFGRRIYALGGNEEAARLSGINIFSTRLWVYTIISTLAAFGGILSTSRLNGASPNDGLMLELDVIAAVVIGGTSLSGGSGTIIGSVIGTFIIGILNNGMSLMGVGASYQNIIKGFIIILAVSFDVIQKKKLA